MEPIFNSRGDVVGWRREDRVLDLNGRTRTWIRGENIMDLRGVQRGRYVAGFFRDPNGHAVAFTRGASGGPIVPGTGGGSNWCTRTVSDMSAHRPRGLLRM